MLFEGKCPGIGPTMAAQKYGYSKQRYFQILSAFLDGGSTALIPQKTGPKTDHVRTENTATQIFRHRFPDPEAKAEVIAQKMRQTGIKVSQRRVERTITEYGLQKNFTSFVPTTRSNSLRRIIPKNGKKSYQFIPTRLSAVAVKWYWLFIGNHYSSDITAHGAVGKSVAHEGAVDR